MSLTVCLSGSNLPRVVGGHLWVYERHARAARALAEEHFDAEKILTRVLERVA